jgi:hypothetical protein
MDMAWPRLEQRLGRIWLFVPLACAAVVIIVGLARNLSFHGDEWAYIVDRRLTLESLLTPHNEHLVSIHVLVYRGMVEVVGVGSYIPYLLVLAFLHIVAAAGVLTLLRAHLAAPAAMAATVLFLFLGTGFDNLVWAFQIGFVGSMAAGIWALVAASRAPLAAALLTVAVWTTGAGLFFVLPVAVLVQQRRWLAVPLLTYAAWFLLARPTLTAPPDVGSFLAYGATVVGSAFGGVTGAGPVLGGLVALAVGVALSRAAGRGPLPRIALAGLAGLVGGAVILAVGRAHFGWEQALAPRYIYLGAPFIFMLLPALRIGWRPAWGALFALALAANIAALPYGVALYHAFLNYDRSIPLEQRLAPFR